MEDFKEKTENIAKKLHLKKITSLVVAGLAILLFLIDWIFFHGQIKNILFGFDGVLLLASLVVMMFVAGFTVMKSLFHVSAGLSLLVFLAQSYCASPNLTAQSNTAMRSLLVIGLLYIAFDFCEILYKGLKQNLKNVETVKHPAEKAGVTALFVVFACLLVWAIYQMMYPIVLGFCVFR